jgi:rare lipoprotein A
MATAVLLALLLSGCASHKRAQVSVPPPPASEPQAAPPSQPTALPPVHSRESTASVPRKNLPAASVSPPISVSPGAKPIIVETGLASWYGAPYHNRVGSNGKIYDMNAMTAAHRTLPLGSIVRVTNIKTGHSVLVRITDRGPFIPGRVLDLSLAAAKQVDVWLPGLATVRLEVLETPSPLDSGGRWEVQIGAFGDEDSAREMAGQLTRRYHTAKVLSFSSPVGDWWVRVRVLDDDRKRAEEITREARTSEGAIFLVRLD